MKAKRTNYDLINFILFAVLIALSLLFIIASANAENTIQYNATEIFNSTIWIYNESVLFSVNGTNTTFTNINDSPAFFVNGIETPYMMIGGKMFLTNRHVLPFTFNLPNYTFYIQNSTVVYEQNITYIVNLTNSTYINNTCMPQINYSQIPNLTITCPNVLINDSSNISITIDNVAVLDKLELFYNLSARNDCPSVVNFMNASVQPVLYQNKYLQDRSEFLQKEIDRVVLNNTLLEQERQNQDTLLSYVGLVAFVLFVLFVGLIVIISVQFGWGEQQ